MNYMMPKVGVATDLSAYTPSMWESLAAGLGKAGTAVGDFIAPGAAAAGEALAPIGAGLSAAAAPVTAAAAPITAALAPVGALAAPLMAPLALGGALVGGVKWLMDRGKAQKQRRVEATKTLYSPWTGQQGRDVESSDLMQNAMQGGLAGAQFGQGLGQQQQAADMNNAWMRYLAQKKG